MEPNEGPYVIIVITGTGVEVQKADSPTSRTIRVARERLQPYPERRGAETQEDLADKNAGKPPEHPDPGSWGH